MHSNSSGANTQKLEFSKFLMTECQFREPANDQESQEDTQNTFSVFDVSVQRLMADAGNCPCCDFCRVWFFLNHQ